MSADRFIDISEKEIIAQENAKLINGYKTLGLSVEELRELDVMGARLSILPMLSFFNVPLSPPIIRNVARDIIKVASLFPKSNICEYTSVSGGHRRVLISLPCTSSHASFKKCCCDLVAGLPKKLISVK